MLHNLEPVGPHHEQLISDVERVTHLPHSQAFEQIMYDGLSSRVTRFASEHPIVFHPKLLRMQFPENLRDCFVSSNELVLNDFRIVQLLQADTIDVPRRASKMAFTTNDFEYTFTTDGGVSKMEVSTMNGQSVREFDDADYTAFLASIVYNVQYTPEDAHSPDTNEIKLAQDTIYVRSENSDMAESMVERMIMTLGEFAGKSETITTTLFDTGNSFLEVELKSQETPRTSSVNNTMQLSKILDVESLQTGVFQNDVLTPKRLNSHYAMLATKNMFDDETDFEVVLPDEDFEKYAHICSSFLTHISPLLAQYEPTLEVD